MRQQRLVLDNQHAHESFIAQTKLNGS
jgi:hypothetical protein